ncbi:hypothetical protein OP10G_1636 [Fimbriimonas ginsengisoli Gsoil 348]|uniref:Uncharacterized protein n=1 Tax=Fimbriimonas ginsengisoli Gsoil 348 TaxID=661478 RepID=A0A068NTT3_FIMGI|nr:hypothetical protein OP10G_1636 [Fimbriimonas ginsengisoli Gsoil 348]
MIGKPKLLPDTKRDHCRSRGMTSRLAFGKVESPAQCIEDLC